MCIKNIRQRHGIDVGICVFKIYIYIKKKHKKKENRMSVFPIKYLNLTFSFLVSFYNNFIKRTFL